MRSPDHAAPPGDEYDDPVDAVEPDRAHARTGRTQSRDLEHRSEDQGASRATHRAGQAADDPAERERDARGDQELSGG